MTVNSGEYIDERLKPTSCFGIFSSQGYPIKRKVIDIRGRLGSLYDSTTDVLIDQYSVERFKTKQPNKRHACEIFRGNNQSKDPVNYLEFIGFNRELQQSIRHQRMPISGVARIIEYNQSITSNTRFFYYSYHHLTDELNVQARKAHEIVSPPQGSTDADYMITKIEWGFEILCIIQISQHISHEIVDQLLFRIRSRLKLNQLPIDLDENDRRIIDQLNNITIFGTETCLDDSYTPLHIILDRISIWQNDDKIHRPLIYTMQPLRWLFGAQIDRRPVAQSLESRKQIDNIYKYLQRIDNQLKDLSQMLYRLPRKFPSEILNQRLRTFQQHYQLLINTQKDLEQHVQNIILDVRKQRVSSTALNQLINNLDYHCLQQSEIICFRTDVTRLLNKAQFIDELNKDGFEYINAFDIGSITHGSTVTIEIIDAVLRQKFSRENNPVILWYTGDRLKREHATKWREIYEHLLIERQRTRLIYVDFTQCQQRLEKQLIIRLPQIDLV